jgi:MYXO-CTERM domain-containing protein
MSLRLPLSAAGLGLALLAFAPSASAHIRLLSHAARYDITGFDTGIKSCPCGSGMSNRSCNLATDASDPDGRSDNVTRVEAGSQIVLRFEEYVDHQGSYRVAFDPDGADMADFDDNILVPIVPDPENEDGLIWEIPVTIPNMSCDNCTLQLIQAMHGDQTNPVTDPSGVNTYYQCIDLEIVPPGTLGEEPMGAAGSSSMPMGAAGSSSMPMMGAGGSGSMTGGMNAGTSNTNPLPVAPMGDNMGGGASPAGMTGSGNTNMGVGMLTPGSSTGSAATPAAMSASESSDSGGCALGAAGSGSRWAALGLAGAVALLARRRRSRAA